jgi:hypothetical protein
MAEDIRATLVPYAERTTSVGCEETFYQTC